MDVWGAGLLMGSVRFGCGRDYGGVVKATNRNKCGVTKLEEF